MGADLRRFDPDPGLVWLSQPRCCSAWTICTGPTRARWARLRYLAGRWVDAPLVMLATAHNRNTSAPASLLPALSCSGWPDRHTGTGDAGQSAWPRSVGHPGHRVGLQRQRSHRCAGHHAGRRASGTTRPPTIRPTTLRRPWAARSISRTSSRSPSSGTQSASLNELRHKLTDCSAKRLTRRIDFAIIDNIADDPQAGVAVLKS